MKVLSRGSDSLEGFVSLVHILNSLDDSIIFRNSVNSIKRSRMVEVKVSSDCIRLKILGKD